ncbi:hypothetical protein F2Q70_00029825 [Brassica cretica]|uniref:Uncharacterized protein n=2 Tax=Brassica cretica TaxID=69181 RepID=A0A8S9FGV0_BRACR|nr:hypothetical protein F2Q70_00029825 [Brassica cretica]KAF2552789.1 hypothetical protein F2Q68_00034291 [Brassica cretica]KAF3591076.1 hypothetical protein DY000_02022029 [Brassica cretica]
MHLHLFVPEAKENSCKAVKVEDADKLSYTLEVMAAAAAEQVDKEVAVKKAVEEVDEDAEDDSLEDADKLINM